MGKYWFKAFSFHSVFKKFSTHVFSVFYKCVQSFKQGTNFWFVNYAPLNTLRRLVPKPNLVTRISWRGLKIFWHSERPVIRMKRIAVICVVFLIYHRSTISIKEVVRQSVGMPRTFHQTQKVIIGSSIISSAALLATTLRKYCCFGFTVHPLLTLTYSQ